MILLIYVYVSGVISSFSVELKDKIVNIELESHKSSTRDLVGLQLWRGAFLLAEYLCHASNIVKNQNVLELAAGTGFTSLVAALTAKKVICTGMYFCGSNSHQSKYFFFLGLIENVSITKTWFSKLLQVATLVAYQETSNRHQNFSLPCRQPQPCKSGIPT